METSTASIGRPSSIAVPCSIFRIYSRIIESMDRVSTLFVITLCDRNTQRKPRRAISMSSWTFISSRISAIPLVGVLSHNPNVRDLSINSNKVARSSPFKYIFGSKLSTKNRNALGSNPSSRTSVGSISVLCWKRLWQSTSSTNTARNASCQKGVKFL